MVWLGLKIGSTWYSGSAQAKICSAQRFPRHSSTTSSAQGDLQYTMARKRSRSRPEKLPCVALRAAEVKLDRATICVSLRVAEEKAGTIVSSRVSACRGRRNRRWSHGFACSWRRKKPRALRASLRVVEEWTRSRSSAHDWRRRKPKLLRFSVHGGKRNWVARLCAQWRKKLVTLCATLRAVEKGTNCFLPSSDLSSPPLICLSFYSDSFCCSRVWQKP